MMVGRECFLQAGARRRRLWCAGTEQKTPAVFSRKKFRFLFFLFLKTKLLQYFRKKSFWLTFVSFSRQLGFPKGGAVTSFKGGQEIGLQEVSVTKFS